MKFDSQQLAQTYQMHMMLIRLPRDASSPIWKIYSLLFLCELTLCLEVEPAFPFPLMDTKMRLSVYLNEY